MAALRKMYGAFNAGVKQAHPGTKATATPMWQFPAVEGSYPPVIYEGMDESYSHYLSEGYDYPWYPAHSVDALRELFAELLRVEAVNSRLTGMVSALDVRYPIDGGNPLTGARVPDADLKTSDGDTRVYRLLHSGRGVLLDLTDDPALRATANGWADRVDVVPAHCADERLNGAAVPSLVIVAVGLVPVILVCRGLGRRESEPEVGFTPET